MIATTSLALSTRLQELAPGWRDTHAYWFRLSGELHKGVETSEWTLSCTPRMWNGYPYEMVIAPDLDWLLNRLGYPTLERNVYGIWLAKYYKKTPKNLTGPMNALGSGITPCDAACALLIKLIETGIVKV